MPQSFPVTAEMLAAGRDAAAWLAPRGVFTDEWWAAVYRAMRVAEPPLCRGEPVEILVGTESQIEAAVERFARRIENIDRQLTPGTSDERDRECYEALNLGASTNYVRDRTGCRSWPPPGAS